MSFFLFLLVSFVFNSSQLKKKKICIVHLHKKMYSLISDHTGLQSFSGMSCCRYCLLNIHISYMKFMPDFFFFFKF